MADYKLKSFQPQQITSTERGKRHLNIYAQKPLLEVKDLEKIYSNRSGFFTKSVGFQAVSPISFSLFPGETLGLVGESGCGKSTLAKALIFLDPPSAGQVLFKGKTIRFKDKSMMRDIRQKIQFVFQDPYASLHPLKNIGNAIQEVLARYTPDTKSALYIKTVSLLEQVGLSESYYSRYPHELSGGQRQRIVIARALATQPELLICDESVAALDISVQAQVLNLLNQLKTELGLSYLFISHDLAVVKYMSDRVMVMQNGKLVELQEADALYKNPKNTYTKKLIGAIS